MYKQMKEIQDKIHEASDKVKMLEEEQKSLEYSDAWRDAKEKARPKESWKTTFKTGAFPKVEEHDMLTSKALEGLKWIVYSQELQNENEFEEYMSKWGSCEGWDNHKSSVTYYVMNKILLHTGGGHVLVPTPRILTDEEIEKFMSGHWFD